MLLATLITASCCTLCNNYYLHFEPGQFLVRLPPHLLSVRPSISQDENDTNQQSGTHTHTQYTHTPNWTVRQKRINIVQCNISIHNWRDRNVIPPLRAIAWANSPNIPLYFLLAYRAYATRSGFSQCATNHKRSRTRVRCLYRVVSDIELTPKQPTTIY